MTHQPSAFLCMRPRPRPDLFSPSWVPLEAWPSHLVAMIQDKLEYIKFGGLWSLNTFSAVSSHLDEGSID